MKTITKGNCQVLAFLSSNQVSCSSQRCMEALYIQAPIDLSTKIRLIAWTHGGQDFIKNVHAKQREVVHRASVVYL